jgi:hypothetical protein
MANEPTKTLPIRPDDKLPPCPFCGSSLTEVVAVPFDSERNNRVIQCTKCGSQGPKRWPPTSKQPLDLVEARGAWSARTPTK